MNTKLLFLTVIAALLLCVHVRADDGDEYVGLTDPNDDSPFLSEPDDTEEEEEQKVEDTSNSPSTNDQTDETQPENEKIKEGADIADGNYHTFNMNKCEFIQIELQRKATQITANNGFNLAAFMVTSTPFVNCDDITIYDCPEEEGFCDVRVIDTDDSPIELNQEACELDVLYLYPIPIDTTSASIMIEVKVTMGDELECDARPDTSATTSATGDSSGASEQEPSGLQHPASKVIGTIILVCFTLFVLVVCFYRCQFRKNGTGPFTPPNFCPGFVFPRQKMSGFMAIQVDKRQELTDYEPPVPVL